jgi:hypothetical protein
MAIYASAGHTQLPTMAGQVHTCRNYRPLAMACVTAVKHIWAYSVRQVN